MRGQEKQLLSHRNHQGIGQLCIHTLANSSPGHLTHALEFPEKSQTGDSMCNTKSKKKTFDLIYEMNQKTFSRVPLPLRDQHSGAYRASDPVIKPLWLSLIEAHHLVLSAKYRTEIRRNGPCGSRREKQAQWPRRALLPFQFCNSAKMRRYTLNKSFVGKQQTAFERFDRRIITTFTYIARF